MTTPAEKTLPIEHEFVLVLSGISEIGPDEMDALFEAGCDDATPSIRHGRVYLAFAREAPSFKDALLSAIADVSRAQIGARVLMVDPSNLVSQAEIARRIGRSRQLVNQYVTGKRGGGHFPAPICDLADGNPLWSWCDVSDWLHRNGIVSAEALEASRLISAINCILEFHHQQEHGGPAFGEFRQLVEAVSMLP